MVVSNMEQFIIRDLKESENEYRLRVWKSREVWDYVQIEWKEDNMKDYMMEKMLQMKKQIYSFGIDKIDETIAESIYDMGRFDRSTQDHEYVWHEYYIEYLKERKDELKMEVGMKRCRI
jgi:hypothetical protein